MISDLPNGIDSITYDYRNLPIKMKRNGIWTTMRYDANGNRTYKSTPGGQTLYYLPDASGKTLAVLNSDGSVRMLNAYGLDNIGYMSISDQPSRVNTRYYYLKDHLGTIKMTVDSAGMVTSYDDYYTFGMLMEGRSGKFTQADARYKFTGKERDSESRYDYFGARYYDARVGRWSTSDPLAARYPQFSFYSYAANSPLVIIDPHGDTVKFVDANLEKQHKTTYEQKDASGNYVNQKYRSQFDQLNASDVMYLVSSADLGGPQNGMIKLGDFGTKDGKTISITLDVARGATIGEELSHEFVHGVQFERGEIYLWRNNENELWGTVGNTIGLEDEAFRQQQIPKLVPIQDLNIAYPSLVGKNHIQPFQNPAGARKVERNRFFFGVLQSIRKH